MFDAKKIREDFPIFKKSPNLVYFDSAATSQKPRIVIETIKEFYEDYNSNIHRGVYSLSLEASKRYEEAHYKVAELINADKKEIIFTKNATEALNLVAYSYAFYNIKEGDEIVTTIMEHHSNFLPWKKIAELKGAKLKFIKLNKKTYELEFDEKIITEKTKIVALCFVSNFLGIINPVKEIIKIAKEKGAVVVLDGAQAVPHLPVDVKEIGCDFLAASGHKMLGPSGTGFLWGRKELLEKMEPFIVGGGAIENVKIDEVKWASIPWKFEAGTPIIAGGIALGEAAEYLKNIGMENVFEHEKELTNYCIERMKEIEEVEIYGSSLKRVGVIPFNVKGADPHDIAGMLDSEGICVRSGRHCTHPLLDFLGIESSVRISFYIYNTVEEIDRFMEALKRIISYLK
uniref:Cysteine desulfurase n=1 Tax=candidate division WOR-3 bacterium TaxID=2052148 RepID=A0A7V3ZTK4_UNCW3